MNYNFVIIGNYHSHPSAKAFLNKISNLLIPISNKIILISGDRPNINENKLFWIKTNLKTNETNFFTKSFHYVEGDVKSIAYTLKYAVKNRDTLFLFLNPSPLVMMYAKLFHLPIIRYEGGSYSKQQKVNFVKKFLFEIFTNFLADNIIVESQSSIKFQNLNKYLPKIRILKLFVDIDKFKCLIPYSERKKVIGYIGNMDSNKGVDKLINFIVSEKKFLLENNIEFHFYGNGPLLKQLQNQTTTNDLEKAIKIFGWVNNSKIPIHLNQMKLLLILSKSEGVPNILLEAMSCGTPVLATSVGGIPDIIKDNDTGFILNSTDPVFLHTKINCLLNDDILLQKVSCNSIIFINEYYNYQIVSLDWKNLFKQFKRIETV